MQLVLGDNALHLRHAGRVLLAHGADAPCFFTGHGRADVAMYRGNFAITDRLDAREPLRHVAESDGALVFRRHAGDAPQLVLRAEENAHGLALRFIEAAPGINRLWIRLPAEPGEAVWGCGEQMSYFDLRGRRFPLWTSEPGVGRDKNSPITFEADVTGRAGGDYWTTNYPQPTYVTPRAIAVHLETTAYAEFDFRDPDFHELHAWAIPERLEFLAADTLPELVTRIAARFGRQPALPDWTQHGVILGLKRGQAHAEEKLALAERAGIPVAALWCEDWAGVRQTSFGTRLFWDWQWSRTRYPAPEALTARLHDRGIRFLGYANPYLCTDGALFPEAERAGAFARDAAGRTAPVDFGEFDCGVIDFTSEDATDWFVRRILRQNMLDCGLDGWMADFGEYLPTDVVLADGDPMLEHNRWPVRWAAANARAIAEAGRTGDALFFMRAGFTGTQAHCPLMWAGDQCVDFSRHDGLVTAITGALSTGLLGHAYSHSDLGGYTSLFGLRRTSELFMRWAELAAFTPVMRTHEGNRPTENFQWWEDTTVTRHFAAMAALFAALAPYRAALIAEAVATGLPLMRALPLHFAADRNTHGVHDQFLLGPDLLVAPVHTAGAESWRPYLPAGASWTHLWTGTRHPGGDRVEVPAPFGRPPVFLRDGSEARPGLAEFIAAATHA